MSDKRYVITRQQGGGTTNGVPHDTSKRVYVTGPHFGSDVFSSTADPAKASRYTQEEAERILHPPGRRRYWPEPRIEEATTSPPAWA